MSFKKQIFYLVLIASAFLLIFPKLSLAADFDLSIYGTCPRSQPQAVLSWQAATGTPYQIWRSENGGPYSQISSTTSLSYIDTNIFSDRRYDYQIKTSGVPQWLSGQERLNPLYCAPYLDEPVTLCLSDGPRISLDWDAISGSLDFYKIWRAKDGGSFQVLTDTAADSHIDGTNLYGNSQYGYYIQAFWSDGGSATSSIWTKTAPACPPTLNYATTCLQSVEPGGPRVNLSWNQLLGVQEYDIYQIPPGTTSATRIATTTAITYSDNLVQSLPNQYYNNGTVSYYVQAVWSGVSRDSSTKQVSIFPCPPFLRVNDICQGRIFHLYWTATLGVSNYNIYRGDEENPPNTYIDFTQPGVLYYDDSAPDQGSFTYKIIAVASPVNQISNFVFQDIDCLTPNPPSPPPSFFDPVAKCQACGPVPSDSVAINSWSSSNNVLYYNLFRSGTGVYGGTSTSFTDCGGEKGFTYNYSVIAFGQNATSGSATSATVTFVDCDQPSTPDPVTFNTGCGPLGSYVSLSWNLTTNTYNYEVWRKEGAGDYSLKSTLAPDVHAWTDVPVVTSTLYYYKVIAKGPPGAPSKESSIKTLTSDSCVPTLPVLTFSRDCNVTIPLIILNWTTNGVNTASFDIYRQDFSTTIPIASLGGSARTWTDSPGGNNVTYQYKIVAVGYLGQKTSTSYQSVTSWYCAPPGPFTLNAPTISCGSAPYTYPRSQLSWGASSNVLQYRLNRYLYSGTSVTETTTVVATITSPYFDQGYGNVMSFSGDDYVIVPAKNASSSLNNLKALTIEAWVRPNTTSSFMGVLGTGINWNSSGTSLYFRSGQDTGDREIINFNITTNAGPYQNIRWGTTTKFLYQADRWYHVVGTFSSSSGLMMLYVDGQWKETTVISTSSVIVNSSDLKIGDTDDGTGIGSWRGNLENVRIYGRDISAAEVSNHYQGIYTNENELRGVWYFDEGTGGAGQKISDSTNYGNNGTATGTPAWATNGLQSGSKYNWQILAYSRGSVPTISNYASPSAMTMFYCTPIKSGLVLTPDCVGALAVMKLEWSYSYNATSFQIYRNGSLAKTLYTSDPEFSSRTWIDDNSGSGLNNDTDYTYRVRSVGGAGFVDSDSLIKRTPFMCNAPSVPLNVQANLRCSTSSISYYYPEVLLTWQAVSGAEYYEIFRRGESYRNNIYATSFVDIYPYVSATNTYYYSVMAHNTVGGSPLSASSSVYVDFCKATMSTTSISTYCRSQNNTPINEISWKDFSFFNSAEYKIWRLDPDSTTTLIGMVSTADSYAFKPVSWFSSYADCANSPTLENLSQQLTIELWIKPNEYYYDYARHVITKATWDGITDNFALYFFGSGSSYNKKITFYATGGGVWKRISPFSPELNLGQWYHVVLSYSSTTGGYLYLNGVSQGSPVGSGNLATNTVPVKIGNLKDGLIDEVRIYNRALSATEVGEHYNKIYTNEKGLKGHWRLNEGSGNGFTDSSGFSNNCAVWYGESSWQKLESGDPTYYLRDTKFGGTNKKFVDDGSVRSLNSSSNYNYWIETSGQKGDATTSPFVSMLTYGCNLQPNPPTITGLTTGCLSLNEPYDALSWTTTTNTLSSNIYRISSVGTSTFYTRLSSFQDKGSHALDFNGSNQDNVIVPDSSSIDGLNAMSVEIWYYIPSNATTTSYTLITDDWLGLHTFRDETFHLEAPAWSCGAVYCPSGYIGVGITPNKGQWNHLVVTHDRYQVHSNMKLYFNGALRSEKDFPYGLRNSGSAFMINPGWTGNSNYYGLIDEVRIYGRALSAAEVAEHYNGVYKNEIQLRGAWHFDEGTSTVAYDSSGRNNNANLFLSNGVSWLKINEFSSFYNDKIHSLSLEENTLYTYQVKLAAQSRESNSTESSITTPECGPWIDDRTFTVTPQCSSGFPQIYLDWEAGNVVNTFVYKKRVSQPTYATTQVYETQHFDSNVESGIEYDYYVEIEGLSGVRASTTPTSTTALFCSIPPETPVMTGATSSCYHYDSRIKISWTGGADTISYDILRKSESCTGSGGFSQINNVAVGTNEYLDPTNLQNSTDYCYQIKAIGSGTNNFSYSDPSVGVSGTTTLDCAAQWPNPPVEITSLVGESYWESTTTHVSRVKIYWSEGTTNADRFLIMRKIFNSGDPFVEVGHVSGDELTFTDYDNIIEDVTYEYRIDAANVNGTTPGGNLRNETVPISPPGPFSLSGEWINGFTRVSLSWTKANTTPVGGTVTYRTLRDETQDFSTTEICGPSQNFTCIDNNPTFFEPWYIIEATNAKGKITYSNPVNMYGAFSLIWKEIAPQ